MPDRGAGSSGPGRPARRLSTPACRGRPETVQVPRWLGMPSREVGDLYRQAIELWPNGREFVKEVEESGEPRPGSFRPPRASEASIDRGARSGRKGVRARGVSMLTVGLGAHVGFVSSTAGSRRSAGRAGAGGPVAAGTIVGTNGKLPDNVLAPVWSAAYGLYRHRCLPRAFLDRSRRDEWHEQ